jgi:oligosaccharide repeat unit polymerase
VINTYNPFFAIPAWVLLVTKLYVGLFVILIPVVKILFLALDLSVKEYFCFTMISNILTALPVILPFKNVGLIHPLVYPFYFNLLKGLGKNPFLLLDNFRFSTEISGTLAAEINNIYTSLDVNIQSVLLNILWTLMLYAGYFVISGQVHQVRKQIPPVQFSAARYYLASVVFIAAALAYFQSQGGILAYMNSWGVNRSDSLEGLGPIIMFFTVAFLVPLSWYAQKGWKVFLNPVFLLILFFSMFIRFLSSGSRSSILVVMVSFIIIFMMQNQRIPWKRTALAGFVFFVLIGALGTLRQQTWRGEASWDTVFKSDLNVHMESTLEEGALWNELGASHAVYLKVPEQVEYLYGKTYLTGLLFFIPRFLWPDKPHSVGYYTGRLIFNRAEAGIPPGDVAEAYWNFSFAGVAIIAFLNGILYKLFANYYRRNYQSLFSRIIYTIVLTSGLSLAGLAISQLMQRLLLGVPLLRFLKIR